MIARIATLPAPDGIARPGNEGKPHTIISVFRKVDEHAETYLGRVIEDGEPDERPAPGALP